jgi:thymidine kinase
MRCGLVGRAVYLEEAQVSARLTVITGCMFSGKTTELLRRLRMADKYGLNVEAFYPDFSVRRYPGFIATHENDKFVATPIRLVDGVATPISVLPETHLIVIDEIQFISNAFELVQAFLEKDLNVIVGGLDLDYLGRPFGPMPTLLAHASEVQKLTATKCATCARPASRTHRKSDDAGVVVVGGADRYEPRCYHCHRNALSSVG